MEKWLDRQELKTTLGSWLTSKFPRFLLTIDDSREFEDVTAWFEYLEDFKVCVAYLNVDSEVTCFGLLESIVEEFGREHFPNFTALQAEMSEINTQIIINQTIGAGIDARIINNQITESEITSELPITFERNNQTVNINNPDVQSVRRFYFENRINEFLQSFLKDLYNLNNDIPALIVCRFRGSGFDNLAPKFGGWFQDEFIRRLKGTGVKITVICEANAGKLTDAFDDYQFRLGNLLRLDAIIPVAAQSFGDAVKGEFFCRGIVSADDNTIDYSIFATKLRKQNPV